MIKVTSGIKRALPNLPTPSRLPVWHRVQQSTSTNVSISELQYPDSSTANHNSLPSFLEYASRVNLDPQTTTYVGTHYEYMVQASLETVGMSLKRIGGKSDYGIDLLGTWELPSVPQPLKVLVQCKAFAAKVKPTTARELEGAFVGAPQGWRGAGVLGFLISQKPATKGVREALGRSRWPMGYVLCDRQGKISQMLWNRRAEQEGLEGISVGLRYNGGERNEKEVILTWKDEIINWQTSPLASSERLELETRTFAEHAGNTQSHV